jgi:hypothetical protein
MPKHITSLQLKAKYWPAWNAARKALIASGTYSKEEAEALRKDIHVAICGYDCSSKDLTNRQLDSCLAKFSMISNPNDGKQQADLADQPLNRIRYVIKGIQRRLQLPDAYVESMAQNMARRRLELCDELQLKSILKALKVYESRHTESSKK